MFSWRISPVWSALWCQSLLPESGFELIRTLKLGRTALKMNWGLCSSIHFQAACSPSVLEAAYTMYGLSAGLVLGSNAAFTASSFQLSKNRRPSVLRIVRRQCDNEVSRMNLPSSTRSPFLFATGIKTAEDDDVKTNLLTEDCLEAASRTFSTARTTHGMTELGSLLNETSEA